ncbi:MAG: hypothetical protein U1E65_36220 [Myxococcota bacterium]
MGRIVCIEQPGNDAALKGVAALIANPSIIEVVNDSGGYLAGASATKDMVGALRRSEALYPANGHQLQSFDIIGHGAPGYLSMGATSNGGPVKNNEWCELSSDMDKVLAWSPFARTLRRWKAEGRLAPSFEVRILGCRTAVDPGIVPEASLATLFDGAALLHLLSSFLDVPVRGSLEYLFPENFKSGELAGAKTRVCQVDPRSGKVSFDPDADGGSVGSVTDEIAGPGPDALDAGALAGLEKDLFASYDTAAKRLRGTAPLVAATMSPQPLRAHLNPQGSGMRIELRPPGSPHGVPARYQVVEHGRALLVWVEHPTGAPACYRLRCPPKGYRAALSNLQVLQASQAPVEANNNLNWSDAATLRNTKKSVNLPLL